MKTRIVIGSLVATLMAIQVMGQHAEYDDMYFTAKDREKNKALEANASFTASKTKKRVAEQVSEAEEPVNPTDSYSSRNVNPEYISRSNSEQASEDEDNYYVEGYTPATTNYSSPSYNNSYYGSNNYYRSNNWARNSWYASSAMNNPYYGYNDPWISPYSYSYYDPWMMNPYYGGRSGWSVSFNYTWGNYSPWNYGMGYGWGSPYGYSSYYSNAWYPSYYYGGSGYYETVRPNYGKRPSRHSAVVTPTRRSTTRGSSIDNGRTINTATRSRSRYTTDEYYVRPSRRASGSDDISRDIFTRPSMEGSRRDNNRSEYSQPSRTRESYNPPRENRSSTPSYSPSRSSGGSSGGSSSPRPRGRN